MRPSVGKLITKLKRLDVLGDQPDAVTYINEAIARHYFVHERLRPADAFENFIAAYRVWQAAMGYPTHLQDQRNDRQLELAQNAVTGDELLEKVSLPAPRNDASPGPSHKSPVGYKAHGELGFTIPGFEGKWIWVGRDNPPNMDEVVEALAAGVNKGRSPEIDLSDKKLMKRVRRIIWEHGFTLASNDRGVPSPACECDEEFEQGEEWASHVRKLIWKELKA